MRCAIRLGTAAALGLAAWLAPHAALAKDVCVHTAVDGGWTFVLHKAKLKPGTSGAVSGYAVRDGDGLAEAVSGGYMVFPTSIYLGATRYVAGFGTMGGGGGVTWVTYFHQIGTDLDPQGAGSDYAWTKDINGAITTASGDANVVDCAGVPAIPKQ